PRPPPRIRSNRGALDRRPPPPHPTASNKPPPPPLCHLIPFFRSPLFPPPSFFPFLYPQRCSAAAAAAASTCGWSRGVVIEAGEGGGTMQPSANGSENTQPQAQQQQALPPQHQRHAPAPQWMAAMPYPTATMVMQRQMMAAGGALPPPQYAPHYVPYHHVPPPMPLQYHQQPVPQQQQGSAEENRTIWVGDLQFWMDENYLQHCFGHTGEVVLLKVIRNKQTGQSEGYGFVEFYSHGAAEKVLQTFSGMIMPSTDQPFRINWAGFSMGDKRSDTSSDHSIFVGDLASDVTDNLLQETFASRYSSVKGAKVVFDANSGRSKGYGFVRFGDENEKSRAMTEMNGIYCSSRAMRIGAATPRKSSGHRNLVRIGLVLHLMGPKALRQMETQVTQRSDAEAALQKLNGTTIGKQTVRLSWGRNPMNKQLRADPANQWSNAYYGGQIYNGYGYVAPTHDPSMYAAAYGAYALYGNQQQVR
ncbi:hypothetical protein Taro_015393, partial [Colocasia esculenta]|nr:hypothetical protein [Colocasia esculenta]